MSGEEWTIKEILEIIFATSLLIVLFSAVFVITDPKAIHANIISEETSYIATLSSTNKNIKTTLKYDTNKIKIKEKNNEILVSYNDGKEKPKKYAGNDINIQKTTTGYEINKK